MTEIVVRFDQAEGLQFFSHTDGVLVLNHAISVNILKGMTLRNLEYAVATNLLADFEELREQFSDYLWSEDGSGAPKLTEDQPREP